MLGIFPPTWPAVSALHGVWGQCKGGIRVGTIIFLPNKPEDWTDRHRETQHSSLWCPVSQLYLSPRGCVARILEFSVHLGDRRWGWGARSSIQVATKLPLGACTGLQVFRHSLRPFDIQKKWIKVGCNAPRGDYLSQKMPLSTPRVMKPQRYHTGLPYPEPRPPR